MSEDVWPVCVEVEVEPHRTDYTNRKYIKSPIHSRGRESLAFHTDIIIVNSTLEATSC